MYIVFNIVFSFPLWTRVLSAIYILETMIVAWLIMDFRVRLAIFSWIGSRFLKLETVAAAAGLASVLGDCPLEYVMSTAENRFQYIDSGGLVHTGQGLSYIGETKKAQLGKADELDDSTCF